MFILLILFRRNNTFYSKKLITGNYQVKSTLMEIIKASKLFLKRKKPLKKGF